MTGADSSNYGNGSNNGADGNGDVIFCMNIAAGDAAAGVRVCVKSLH